MPTQRPALLVLPLILFVALLWPLRHGFTDDGYIHIQYANNILALGEYSFNPGAVSYGTTSPLWVLAHAAVGKLVGGGEALMWVSRVLSWCSGVLAVLLMFVFARRLQVPSGLAYLCAVAFAAHAWFVRWTALSMETSSAVLAMIGVGIASIRAGHDPRSAGLLGFFLAAAALLRPEAYLLIPVYLVALAFNRRRVAARCAVTTLSTYAALVLPWLVFAKIHIGRFLPNTAGAKSGGLVLSPVVFAQKFVPIIKIIASAEGIFALLIAVSLLVFHKRSRMLAPPQRFLLMWVVALPVAYVLFDIQVLSRYMLLTSPFLVVLGFVAIAEWGDKRGSLRVLPELIVAVAVAANALFYFRVIVPPSQAFSQNLTHDLKELARFIDRTAEADAVVAAADIGYLAFYSKRRVLDLGGLVENVTHGLRETYSYEEIVERGLYLRLGEYPRVDFMIDREKTAKRFDGKTIEGYRFESVRVDVVANLGIRKPGPFYYTLYRLHRVGDG